jgi:hypothetical protein
VAGLLSSRHGVAGLLSSRHGVAGRGRTQLFHERMVTSTDNPCRLEFV